MDGSTVGEGLVQTWTNPRDSQHPHQRWLQADSNDWKANFSAYLAARPDLSPDTCIEVFELHDSAQHHFITMLLWDRPGLGYMSEINAFEEAVKHHKAVSK